jgi:aspartate aminotransferase
VKGKPVYSEFARSLSVESAFTVLGVAKQLIAAGKDVVELEIGDSPFHSTAAARAAGIEAIQANRTRYCPSPGIPELREAAAVHLRRSYGIPAEAANVVVGPGGKIFEQLFCELYLEPGDGVLVFSPHFPTYLPNIARRGARAVLAPLRQSHDFRPDLDAVEHFLANDPAPKALFLNSPHNPTGGVATREDLEVLASIARESGIAVFSDEPYCHMVWQGEHRSILAEAGMLDHAVGAYTFSKSYSMGGWRLGFAVSSVATAECMGRLINTTLSCTPPFVQWAGKAALESDAAERDATMENFRDKVALLTQGLNRIPGFHTLEPMSTFYVFPDVSAVCNRLGITSHGLAMYLLEGADDDFGVACLGGESFGEAGGGFLRFSTAEADDRLLKALAFIPEALARIERIETFLAHRPHFRLATPYLRDHDS